MKENKQRVEKFKKNSLRICENCCAVCAFFNPETEFCIEMKEHVVPYYTCKKYEKNKIKDIKIIEQRISDICNYVNYLEQHTVSLRDYLTTGITGMIGKRGLPVPQKGLSHTKKIISALPEILNQCENLITCLKSADWENKK